MSREQHNQELGDAYSKYYAERSELENSDSDPADWELPLWEKWESVFIEIYKKFV